MHLFKSKEQNLVHYVTGVTYARVPIFRREEICSLFIEALSETRLKDPFKLIGYVLMPDHFHLLANPIELNISKVVGKLNGRSASKILKYFRAGDEIGNTQPTQTRSAAGLRPDSRGLASGFFLDRYL